MLGSDIFRDWKISTIPSGILFCVHKLKCRLYPRSIASKSPHCSVNYATLNFAQFYSDHPLFRGFWHPGKKYPELPAGSRIGPLWIISETSTAWPELSHHPNHPMLI